MVSISFNNDKLLALVINNDLTLDKLRVEIEKRTDQIKRDDLFLNIHGFPITPRDEGKILISTIVDVSKGDIITIQSSRKPSTLPSSQRESASLSFELMFKTTSISFSEDHQDQTSTSAQLNPTQWKIIYKNASLLRGRRFLPDGPEVADYPVIILKSNWQPNSYSYDNTTMQVEKSCHQTNDESAAYKMYKIETIVKLPFVHLTFGNDSGKCRSSRANTEHSLTVFHYIIRRFVHIFDPTMIELDPKFIDQIDSILNESLNENKYKRLTDLFDKYGHGYAAKVILGGEKTGIERQQIHELDDQHDRQRQVKADFEAASSDFGLGLSLERNKTRTNIRQTSNNNSYENHLTMGGDAFTSDTNEWCEGLKNFETWRVIKYEQIESLYTLLDQERQQKIKAIIDEYQQEQERQRQQTVRCRNVPIELVFNGTEGYFIFQAPQQHQHTMVRRLSFSEPTTILFFYSPSSDEWYLKHKEPKHNIWKSIKRVQSDDEKLKPAGNIIQTLLKTNPMPTDKIMKICQFHDNIHITALTKFGEVISDLVPKKDNFEN